MQWRSYIWIQWPQWLTFGVRDLSSVLPLRKRSPLQSPGRIQRDTWKRKRLRLLKLSNLTDRRFPSLQSMPCHFIGFNTLHPLHRDRESVSIKTHFKSTLRHQKQMAPMKVNKLYMFIDMEINVAKDWFTDSLWFDLVWSLIIAQTLQMFGAVTKQPNSSRTKIILFLCSFVSGLIPPLFEVH